MFNSRGELIGLVTSNTMHAASGRRFSKLNYSIAGPALTPIVDSLAQHDVCSIAWTALDTNSAALTGIWELKQTPQTLDEGKKSHGACRLKELLGQSGKEPDSGTDTSRAMSRL